MPVQVLGALPRPVWPGGYQVALRVPQTQSSKDSASDVDTRLAMVPNL